MTDDETAHLLLAAIQRLGEAVETMNRLAQAIEHMNYLTSVILEHSRLQRVEPSSIQ
jgi:hypothetical protein